MTIEHSDAPIGEIHPVANWNYASAALRTAATGFIAGDIGKAAWQQDDDSFWVLKTATPPSWVPWGGGASSSGGAWGGITGLLSAQADLQAALNAKATPADISAAITALVAAAPGALDTLNELAAALGADANFAATVTAALAGKEPADPAIAKTSAGQTYDHPQLAGIQALTSGAAWDGSLASGKQHLTATVNGSDFAIANPTALAAGAMYMIVVSYATANGITWGSAFKGLSGVTPTATAGATDMFYFRSDGTNLIRAGYALNGGA